MRNKSIYSLILLVLFTGPTVIWGGDELIAYDCSQPVFDRSYSIMNQQPCASQFAGHIDLSETMTQIVQVIDSVAVNAFKCSIEHKKTTGYCNLFLTKSDAAHIKSTDDFISQDISYEECKLLFETRRFSKHGRSVGISLGNLNQLTLSIDLNDDGYCKHRLTYYTIHSYKVLVTITNVQLKFLPSGTFLSYKSNEGLDIHIDGPLSGTTITKTRYWWDRDETQSCRFSLLYGGSATIASDTKGTQIMIIKALTIALAIKQNVVLCNQALAQTNELGIYIADNQTKGITSTLRPSIKVWNPAVLSVSQYLLTQINLKVNQDKEIWNVAFCKLEQSTHLLSALGVDTTPGELGFKVLNDPGWAIIKAGQVLKVAKCREVMYTFNITDRCYSKIPISVEGVKGKLFLDPLTKEIVPSALRESCSSLNLPQIKIRQKWYIFNPKYHEVPIPHQLPSRILNFKDELLEEIRGIALEDMHNTYTADKMNLYSKDIAVNSLLALSDPDIGDNESELWSTSGVLYRLVNPNVTLIHYIIICCLIAICITSNIFLWVLYWKLLKQHKKSHVVDPGLPSTVINVTNSSYPKTIKGTSNEVTKSLI